VFHRFSSFPKILSIHYTMSFSINKEKTS